MKIKNALLAPLLFITPLISCASNQPTFDNESTSTEAQLIGATPLVFATNSIRGALQKSNAHLKNRADATSRSAIFNLSIARNIIKGVYNDADYAAMLSQDGRHIIDFLQLSNELNLDTSHTYECLRLYYNKIKFSEIIDDSVILALLQTLPLALERHFSIDTPGDELRSLEFLKKKTEDIILSRLTDNFSYFQEEPVDFVVELAATLAQNNQDMLHEQNRAHTKHLTKLEQAARLRSLVLRFFDVMLGKMMWNPTSNSCWNTFKQIGECLNTLATYGIIQDKDDLDDLEQSLIARGIFLLDLTGSLLPLDFYTQAEQDLTSHAIAFLEEEEQDEGITSKKELLCRALLNGQIKALAHQQGFYTDGQPPLNPATVAEDGQIITIN